MSQPIWPESDDPADSEPRYANSVTIGMSQWDLTIGFGLAAPEPGSPVPEMRLALTAVSRIVMSPTHAKVLAEMLTKTVGEWERRFGKLPKTAVLMPQPDAPAEDEQ